MKWDGKIVWVKLKTGVHNIYSAHICTTLGMYSVSNIEIFKQESRFPASFRKKKKDNQIKPHSHIKMEGKMSISDKCEPTITFNSVFFTHCV